VLRSINRLQPTSTFLVAAVPTCAPRRLSRR
jgi:hypothetical protein